MNRVLYSLSLKNIAENLLGESENDGTVKDVVFKIKNDFNVSTFGFSNTFTNLISLAKNNGDLFNSQIANNDEKWNELKIVIISLKNKINENEDAVKENAILSIKNVHDAFLTTSYLSCPLSELEDKLNISSSSLLSSLNFLTSNSFTYHSTLNDIYSSSTDGALKDASYENISEWETVYESFNSMIDKLQNNSEKGDIVLTKIINIKNDYFYDETVLLGALPNEVVLQNLLSQISITIDPSTNIHQLFNLIDEKIDGSNSIISTTNLQNLSDQIDIVSQNLSSINVVKKESCLNYIKEALLNKTWFETDENQTLQYFETRYLGSGFTYSDSIVNAYNEVLGSTSTNITGSTAGEIEFLVSSATNGELSLANSSNLKWTNFRNTFEIYINAIDLAFSTEFAKQQCFTEISSCLNDTDTVWYEKNKDLTFAQWIAFDSNFSSVFTEFYTDFEAIIDKINPEPTSILAPSLWTFSYIKSLIQETSPNNWLYQCNNATCDDWTALEEDFINLIIKANEIYDSAKQQVPFISIIKNERWYNEYKYVIKISSCLGTDTDSFVNSVDEIIDDSAINTDSTIDELFNTG